MSDAFEVTPIVVIGHTPNSIMMMYELMPFVQSDPAQIVMVIPAQGQVAGHL